MGDSASSLPWRQYEDTTRHVLFLPAERQWRKEPMTSVTLISSSLKEGANGIAAFLPVLCSFLKDYDICVRCRYLRSGFGVFSPSPFLHPNFPSIFLLFLPHESLAHPSPTFDLFFLHPLLPDWPAATRRAGCRRPPTNQSTGPALEAARPFAKPA